MTTPPLNRAYLSLGSNIRPEINLPAAVELIAKLGRVVRVSRVWQSAPVGDTRQPDFCNAAVLLETALSAEDLCGEGGVLRTIESQLGRERDPLNKNAMRTIDIDLSLFNDEAREVQGKSIPDPDIVSRAFVARPLAELDALRRLPRIDRTLAEVAAELDRDGTLRERLDIPLPGGR